MNSSALSSIEMRQRLATRPRNSADSSTSRTVVFTVVAPVRLTGYWLLVNGYWFPAPSLHVPAHTHSCELSAAKHHTGKLGNCPAMGGSRPLAAGAGRTYWEGGDGDF